MVVVFPAPFGPEQAETFAGLNLEVQAAHGFDLTVIGLAQIAALDGRGTGAF